MSLVGTRPPTVDEWELYEPHHRARMAFRPGLTGMWQVSGRSNIISCIGVYFICSKINLGLISTLLTRGAVCIITPNLIYLLAYRKQTEFKDSLVLVNKMTKGKFSEILKRME